MNQTIKKLPNILIQIVFLGLLLITTSCGKNLSITSTTTRETNLDEDGNNNNPSGPLEIELTSPGQTEGSDTIEFQLTNKGSEDIDLRRINIHLALTDKKDTANIETKAGTLSPKCFSTKNIKVSGGMYVQSGNVTSQTAENLTGKPTLAGGQFANIVVKIVKLEGLASAVVTCELKDHTNKTGNPIIQSVPVKFSAPAIDPQKGDITAIIKKVQFTGAMNELSCELAFKNISDHAVSLSTLKFKLEFSGCLKGSASYTSQELFNTINILEPEKIVTAEPIKINISDAKAISNLKLAVGAENLLSLTIHIATLKGGTIYDLTQPVKLTSPDIAINEIGPKAGSKIEHTLNPQNIVLEDNKLVLPIVFHNTSDHAIDLRKLEHEVKVYRGGKVLNAENYQAGEIKWPGFILSKEKNVTLSYSLPQDLSNSMLQNYNSEYTLEFVTKSAIDQQGIGSVKQLFKIKVGPIAGESKVEVDMLNKITLANSVNANEYKAKFSFEIKNTSEHPIDFDNVIFDITTNIKLNGTLVNFSGIQYSLGSTKLLNPEKRCTLPIEVELGNVTEQEAKNFLTNNSFQFKIIMKTMDGSYIVGTGDGVVKL